MDLRAIQTEVSAVGPVEVTSDQFSGTAETIEDFVAESARTSLDTLKFRANREWKSGGEYVWASVSITRDEAFLGGATDDHQVAGVLSKVEQIMRVRQRRLAARCADTAPLMMALSSPVALSAALLRSDGPGYVVTALWSIAATMIAGAIVTGLIGKFARGGISLESRDAAPTWFQKNRDAILVQLAVGLVLLVVGFALGRAV